MAQTIWFTASGDGSETKTVPVAGGVNAAIGVYINGTSCDIDLEIVDNSDNVVQSLYSANTVNATANVALDGSGAVVAPGYPKLTIDNANTLTEVRVLLVFRD